MNPEKFRRLENIAFNSSMVESTTEKLVDRVEAHLAAMHELNDTYTEKLPEGSSLPENYEPSLSYVVGFIYETRSLAFGDDLKRAIKVNLDHQRLKENDNVWLPQSDSDLQLIEDLAVIGMKLAYKDNEYAFQPHFEGRNHELMDPHDAWYNKYGMLIPGSETYGTFK